MIGADVYSPSPWQKLYHSLPYNEVLGAGAAGPGKSLCLLFEPLAQIVVEHQRAFVKGTPHPIRPGSSKGWALHLRRTFPELRQTIARSLELFPRIDPGASYHVESSTWTFSSGYKYQFGHCRDPNDWMQFTSNEYTIILFDELITFTETQYDQIITRCRTADPVLRHMLKIRSMSNPVQAMDENSEAVASHNPFWVRKRFIEPNRDGKEVFVREVKLNDGSTARWRFMYLPAKLSDNPDPEFVRTYELNLRIQKPHIRKALLDGDWFVTAGAYFSDAWIPSLHICKPFKIPPNWKRFRSMDWGFKVPGCIHWYAMDEDGNLYVEKELTFVEKTDEEVADIARAIEEELGTWDKVRKKSLITGPADTQLWEARGDSGLGKAEVFARKGLSWTKADKSPGSRARNAILLTKRLNDHRDGTRTPGIVFFETCKNAIETIPSIRSDPGNSNIPMDGGPDHWLDSISYGCMFASRGRSGIPMMQPKAEWEEWDDKDPVAKRKSWGQTGYGGI